MVMKRKKTKCNFVKLGKKCVCKNKRGTFIVRKSMCKVKKKAQKKSSKCITPIFRMNTKKGPICACGVKTKKSMRPKLVKEKYCKDAQGGGESWDSYKRKFAWRSGKSSRQFTPPSLMVDE